LANSGCVGLVHQASLSHRQPGLSERVPFPSPLFSTASDSTLTAATTTATTTTVLLLSVRRIDCIDRGSHPLLKPLWGNDHHASSYSRLIILLSHHIPRVHLQRIQQAVQYTLDSTVSSGNAWGRAYADKNNCPVSRQWQWHGNGMFEPMYSVYSVPFLRRAPYPVPSSPSVWVWYRG
jgi:hypothetical protein